VKFRRRRDDDAVINLTPLIDVVFLLLIFFMVSTTFDRHATIQLQLPSAEREPLTDEISWIEILIDARGNYFVDGQELINRRPETLQRLLTDRVREHPQDPILIRADALASHQSVVTALDVVGRMGITAVSIATHGELVHAP